MKIELGAGETITIRTPDGKEWEVCPIGTAAGWVYYGLSISRADWPRVSLKAVKEAGIGSPTRILIETEKGGQ